MFHQHIRRIGPSFTPKCIKIYLFLIALISLLSALQLSFFPKFSLYQLLSLSFFGVKQKFFWQLITYSFLIPNSGLSFSFLIQTLFTLYMVWVFASSLVQRTSCYLFFLLFLLSTLFPALIALIVMGSGYPNFLLQGSSTILYSYLMVWIIANPHSEIRLFFAIPFQAKWLILIFLGINLFFSLLHFEFVSFFSDLAAAFIGYLYAITLFRLHSPFQFLNRMEKRFFHLLKKRSSSKIINMPPPVESHLDDDQFMDAMLTKISLQGRDALTWSEKWRMRKISKRKKQK